MRKFFIIIIWILLSILFAPIFGELYKLFVPQLGESIFLISPGASNFINGISFSYIFFLTLLFTAFGGEKKYWWIGILLIPAVVFEFYFDFAHIYFPILLGLAGWALGFLILKLFSRSKVIS